LKPAGNNPYFQSGFEAWVNTKRKREVKKPWKEV
jgi:hypothetical protein